MRALGYIRRKPPVETTEPPVVEETTNESQPLVESSSEPVDSFEESVSLG